MAFEALAQINSEAAEPVPIHGFKLKDISIQSALVIPDNLDGVVIVFSLRPSQATSGVSSASISKEEFIFSVTSQFGDTWKTHMTGTVSLNPRKKGRSQFIRTAKQLLTTFKVNYPQRPQLYLNA